MPSPGHTSCAAHTAAPVPDPKSSIDRGRHPGMLAATSSITAVLVVKLGSVRCSEYATVSSGP